MVHLAQLICILPHPFTSVIHSVLIYPSQLIQLGRKLFLKSYKWPTEYGSTVCIPMYNKPIIELAYIRWILSREPTTTAAKVHTLLVVWCPLSRTTMFNFDFVEILSSGEDHLCSSDANIELID